MYVVGGRDEKNRALQTVECFDGLTSTYVWGVGVVGVSGGVPASKAPNADMLCASGGMPFACASC